MMKTTSASLAVLASLLGFSAHAGTCPPIEFNVYFDEGSSELASGAQALVEVASENALNAACDIDWIEIIGHTDTFEGIDPEYAENLSDARVRAVNEMLAANEVPRIHFYFDTDEDKNPDVETGPGVKQPLNRRVAVTINFKVTD